MVRRVLTLVFALYLACLFSADEWISTGCQVESAEPLTTICQSLSFSLPAREGTTYQAVVAVVQDKGECSLRGHSQHLEHSKHIIPSVQIVPLASDRVLAPNDQDNESLVFPPYILVPAHIAIPQAPPLPGISVTPIEARGPPVRIAIFPTTPYRGPPLS